MEAGLRAAEVIIEFSSGKLSATTQGNVINDEVEFVR